MDKLSREFLESCRQDNGRILRGENMTRIETFVDAAFAFAFTMLVISIDEIPRSPPELFERSKDIPAFIFSATVIGSLWLAHSNWSRTFGLQDRVTIYLSLAMVMLMLVFVYPIKLLMQATVLYISLAIFGTGLFDNGMFQNEGWANNEVSDLFIYFGVGLIALSLIIIAFFQNSLRFHEQLCLNHAEIEWCNRNTVAWAVVALTAIVSCMVAQYSSAEGVARAGFVYFSMLITIPVTQSLYFRFFPVVPDAAD